MGRAVMPLFAPLMSLMVFVVLLAALSRALAGRGRTEISSDSGGEDFIGCASNLADVLIFLRLALLLAAVFLMLAWIVDHDRGTVWMQQPAETALKLRSTAGKDVITGKWRHCAKYCKILLES